MPGPTWTVVVPVKRLAVAKSRLAPLAGDRRPELALAFALDTVAAALAASSVTRVVVVSDEPSAQAAARALGAVVVADEPDAGLNPALRHGAGEAAPGQGVAAVSADLPALTAQVLDRALALAADHSTSYVPDAGGTGTTLYAARDSRDFAPDYGSDSARRHAAAGAVALTDPALAALRRDVDTPEDLAEAHALGLGPRTAEVLRAIPGAQGAADPAACG